MLILIENAREIYLEIVKRAKKCNGKVVIFVGFDIDSLCTLRILVSLLKGDLVKYEIIPVMNYNQLDRKLSDFEKEYEKSNINGHNNARDIKSFVMINCGGTRDMSKYWFCEEEIDILCLLIDIHRPSHHNNIQSERSIIVIDDSKYELENCPKETDIEMLNKGEDEEDFLGEEVDEGEEERESVDHDEHDEHDEKDELKMEREEAEEGEGEKQEKKRLRIIKKKEDLDTINEEELENDDIDKIINSEIKPIKSKKSALKDEREIRHKIRRKKRIMINTYYSGNYFGYPATFIAYSIATQLNREDSQLLWLLIVSITEHYLQAHISQKMYDDLYAHCNAEVLRLNQGADTNTTKTKKVKKEEIPDTDSKLIQDKYDTENVKVKTVNKNAKTIAIDPDYRLFLFRHWNLYDSIHYSNYTSANLQTWDEQGREQIKKLFTFIGIPLNEAKQKYTYMKNEYKSLFKDKIMQICKQFNLKDIVFNSFVFQYDQISQLSASDFVYCVSALMEHPSKLANVGNGFTNDEEVVFETTDQEEENETSTSASGGINYIDEEKEMRSHYKFDNFWASYDFLSLKGLNMVKTAIDLAIKFQMSMITNGSHILQKKLISGNKNFRYTFISKELQDGKYFHHSISLEKLALYIMDTYHTTKPNFPKKPFLLAVLNEATKKYLVGGVLGNARQFDQEKIDFALRFRVIANKRGAEFMLNNFDECIIEIPDTDFHGFMEEVSQV